MQSGAPLTLDKLPTELQQAIYVNLLKADCVRQPPNQYLFRPYKFRTAILLVSKRIHYIAHDVLYKGNRFIVVTSDWEMIPGALIMYQVAFVPAKRHLVTSFEQHVMRLHLAFASKNFRYKHNNKARSAVLQIFIMPQNELPSLIRMLHMLDLCYGGMVCPFDITLRVEKSVPRTSDLHFQKKLLEPFRRLTSPSLNVKILGCVDAGYAQGLLDDMMYPIRWARAVVWELYSIMESIIKIAEEALQLGFLHTAYVYYEECQRVLSRAYGNNPRLESAQDDGFYISCAVLFNLCDINLVLLGLRDPDATVRAQCAESFLSKTDKLYNMNDRFITLVGKSKIYHYRGVAYAILGRDKDAGQYIRKSIRHSHKSIRHDPQNQLLKYHKAIIKRRMTATSEAEKLAVGTITADELPPIEAPSPSYLPSESIANERYLLRKFNYKGGLLPQIAGSRPTNTELGEKLFVRLDTERRRIPARDILCIWISSDVNDTHAYRGKERVFSVIPDLSQPEFSTSS
ncbi:MAG: hypothetical protein Q9188_007120 [Gyalolechia gomerana]